MLAVRADRRRIAAEPSAAASPAGLAEPCAGFGGMSTVAAALQVIVYEEAEHLRFATRDLDRLMGTRP